MAIGTVQASTRSSVFDAGLPSIAYDHLSDREEALRIVAAARQQAPIAMGPHAPEVLTYELVRTVLRDARFITARGLGLRPHTDPGTRSAVVGAAGPVQHLPPGMEPGFDRVTPTKDTSSGLLVSFRSQASTLGRREAR
jgi:hypothetical protein